MASNEFVYIPVRSSRLSDVFAFMAELESSKDRVRVEEAAQDGQVTTEGDPGLDRALLERMYRESHEAHRGLIEYLAEHPEEWHYTGDLAAALGLPHGARSLAGMLGAFGRRAQHRYGGQTPWISEWDAGVHEAKHRMASEVAEQITAIATS